MTAPSSPLLTILGAGPAGLGVGYFARQRAIPFNILEAGDTVGGNCATRQVGDYRFDLGAHRFHDKDAEITEVVKNLIGNELLRVAAPSAICLGGRFLAFPPTARELLRYLGARRFTAAAADAVVGRAFARRGSAPDLESFAVRAYGKSIARLFLLNYSEKLWGAPCSQLSPRASGGRLRGLHPSTLLKRANGSPAHFEGAFYYPAGGYGRIATRLADECGADTIRTGARVTRFVHSGNRIQLVEINGCERLRVEQVVSTLPLGLAVNLFDPPLAEPMRRAAQRIRFRNLLLVVWFLDRPTVMPYATVYFPDKSIPFTRAYEPRNRSAAMAPAGRTSLAVEIPVDADSAFGPADEERIVESAAGALEALGWIDKHSITGRSVVRIPNAYPMLTSEAERAAKEISAHLEGFGNLHLVGRNGLFQYGWLHTVLRGAKAVVDDLPVPAMAAHGLAR